MLLKIGIRNVFRNRRRSLMTLSAIAVSAAALLNFGQFFANTIVEYQTSVVRTTGHLSIFREGYFEFGAGNPLAFDIANYDAVISTITSDQEISSKLKIITPSVSVAGVAGDFSSGASKTFIGTGYIPSDYDAMLLWDGYGVGENWPVLVSGLQDDTPEVGTIGGGMARILGLCDRLNLDDCRAPPESTMSSEPSTVDAENSPDASDDYGAELQELSNLVGQESALADTVGPTSLPRLDLLSATVGGAPNIVSLQVRDVSRQAIKALDDNYVGMHLALAQKLLYGRNDPRVTSLVLQLNQTSNLDSVRTRLNKIIAENDWGLEVRDMSELNPFYKQAVDFLVIVFVFISIIMGVVIGFSVINTMSMTVMERVNEIGTSRALGAQRSLVRNQFVVESFMLGLIGATLGIALGWVISDIVNAMEISIAMPGQAHASLLILLPVVTVWQLALSIWAGLILICTLAAIVPSTHAANLPVVDSLRHV